MASDVVSTPPASPYLIGHYEPVTDERDDVDLEVVGELPAPLVGTYLRNGPNPTFPPVTRYHVFDGDGMIHAVRLGNGHASYRNRWVRSAGLDAERRAGHALFGGLSEFRLPPPEVMETAGMMKNTANTNVVVHAGRTLAMMEAARPIELDASLATVGEYDFGGALPGAMTAHPKVDPVTGELVFFAYSPFPPFLRYHVADASGVLVESVDVDLPGPVMMHNFAVSARRAVFFDLPAVFDLDAMLAGAPGIRWQPEHGARIGVLDRTAPHDPVQWIDVEPFYVFHFLNAFDDGETVVVDGCRSARMNVSFGDERIVEAVHPSLHRWRIDPARGTVVDEPLDDRPGDFPRIDDRRAGLSARYGYVAASRTWGPDDIAFDGVVKHDLVSGTSRQFSYGTESVAGEAVFAADPTSATAKMAAGSSTTSPTRAGRADLVVVDAEVLEEVARVRIPRRVPFGFHGNWVPHAG